VLGRRFAELREALEPAVEAGAMSKERLEALVELYRLVGTAEEVRSGIQGVAGGLTEKERDELDYLLRLYESLLELRPAATEQPIRLDLSEVGSRSYYTGISFQAYVDRLDSAIASGGRYDSLLASFGFAAPSVGFSMLPRKIASLGESPTELAPVERAEGESFAERYRNAGEAHREGRRARL
jgi:ATP phosphoribosyltransferase regulatory subunit